MGKARYAPFPRCDTPAARAHMEGQQRAVVRLVTRRYAVGLPAGDARELLDMLGLTGTAREMALNRVARP